jgi:hypothetical protein
MLGTPGTHPQHVRRSAKVVAVLRLGQPAALTGGLARLAALGLGAVALMAPIAPIRVE